MNTNLEMPLLLEKKYKLAVEGNNQLSQKLLSLEQENASLRKELDHLRYSFLTKELTIEFFYDSGKGFSNEERLFCLAKPDSFGRVNVSFVLPVDARAISLNIDSYPCFIKNITYLEPDLPPASNGIKLSGNHFLFRTPNPSFAFMRSHSFSRNEKFNFSFQYFRLNEAESSGIISALCDALLEKR